MTTNNTSKQPTHRAYAVTKRGDKSLLARDRRGMGARGRRGLQPQARLPASERRGDRDPQAARRKPGKGVPARPSRRRACRRASLPPASGCPARASFHHLEEISL